jgi:WD40 repeat protein
MPPTVCPSPEELRAFHLGDLCEATLTRLAAHLEECPACESAAQSLDRVTDPVVAAYRRSAQNGPPAVTAIPPAHVGEYDILGEVGRGGMGVVYQARHRRLGRTVALKMLLSGAYADPEERTRFRAEAEAVARLEHPNIVHLFEVGEHDGGDGQTRPYFTLEFVDGESLSARLAGRPQAPRQAAAWVESLAQAAHYAHERGVVHRDLKPSNVLLTVDGVPKLCDFGVAKILTGSDVKTISGAVLGTIEYMAPEQAAGDSTVGPPADIYALGAILYTALTGRPPFQGSNALRTLEQVQSQDPVAPRLLVPLVPRDLNTICLKCLEKKPASRYPSAAALAEDLHRFLAGEPIIARPVSRWERAWKWTRRRPALAALLALSLLVLVVGFPGATILWFRADRARAAADQARDQLEGAVYAGHIALADHAYQDNDVESARGLLAKCVPAPGRPDRRNWEWSYLDRLSHGDLIPGMSHQGKDAGWVFGLAFHPDGRAVVSVAGLPGGSLAGYPMNASEVTPGSTKVWDPATGRCLATLGGHRGAERAVAVSPDGQWLATGAVGGDVCLWDARTFVPRGTIPATNDFAGGLAFTADNRFLVIRKHSALVVWDLIERRDRFNFPGEPPGYQSAMAASPDGRIAFASTAGARPVLRMVDPQTGREIDNQIQTGPIIAVAFSPDGRFLAVAAPKDHRIQIWDAAGTTLLRHLAGHTNDVAALAFCPDGRLVSGSDDHTVRLWDPTAGVEQFQFRGHGMGVQCLAVSPDGRRLAAGDKTGAIKLWDLKHDPRGLAFNPSPLGGEFLDHLAFSADGKTLIVVSDKSLEAPAHNIAHLDPATGKSRNRMNLGPWVENTNWTRYYALSGDTRLVAGADWTDPKLVNVFDTTAGARVATVRTRQVKVNGVSLDATGGRVAISGWAVVPATGGRQPQDSEVTAELIVAAVPGGEEVFRAAVPASHVIGSPALTPDGRRVACAVRAVTLAGKVVTAAPTAAIYIWNLAGGPPPIMEGHFDESVTCAVFSPDGTRIAAAGRDGTLRVWDVATGRPVFAPLQESRQATGIAFSPDGRRLADAGMDGVVYLWDAARGDRLLSLRGLGRAGSGHYGFTARVAFSPDGTRLVANNWDGTVTIWDAAPTDASRAAD